MQETIVITNTFGTLSLPILLIAVFSGFVIYQIIGIKEDKEIDIKFKNVQEMIETGHRKALAGKRDDGIFEERKRLRTDKDAELFGEKQRLHGEKEIDM